MKEYIINIPYNKVYYYLGKNSILYADFDKAVIDIYIKEKKYFFIKIVNKHFITLDKMKYFNHDNLYEFKDSNYLIIDYKILSRKEKLKKLEYGK
jgi:hypothetical protein